MGRTVMLALALCSTLQISFFSVGEDLRNEGVIDDDDHEYGFPSEWTQWQIVDDDDLIGRRSSNRQQRRRGSETKTGNGEELDDCFHIDDCSTRGQRVRIEDEDAHGMYTDITVDGAEDRGDTGMSRQTMEDNEELDPPDCVGQGCRSTNYEFYDWRRGSRTVDGVEMRMSDVISCHGAECPDKKDLKMRSRRRRRRREEAQRRDAKEFLIYCKDGNCEILDHNMLDDLHDGEKKQNRRKLNRKSRRKSSRQLEQKSQSNVDQCVRGRECSTNDQKEGNNKSKRNVKRGNNRENLKNKSMKTTRDNEGLKEIQKSPDDGNDKDVCTTGKCIGVTAVSTVQRSQNTECLAGMNCSTTQAMSKQTNKTTDLPRFGNQELVNSRRRKRRRRKRRRRRRKKRKNVSLWQSKSRKLRQRRKVVEKR